MIPEEAEKSASRIQPWKLELVRESLQFMITDEDKGANDDIVEQVKGKRVRMKKPTFIESDDEN
mgnify:CR=1 FL=1